MKKRFSKKFIILTLSFLIFTSIFIFPASKARAGMEQLYYGYIRRTYGLIINSFYRDVNQETLIKGAFKEMGRIDPSIPRPAAYNIDTFGALYMQRSRQNPSLAGRLGEAALNGMVDALNDPYSVLLTPEKKQILDGGDGSGIGVEIGAKNGKVVVIAPIIGSPAHKAGIKSGDVITSVNGRSAKGLNLYETSMLIHGRRGDKINITVQRGGREFICSPVFAPLKIDPIQYLMLSKNIGYIRIRIFSGKIFEEFVYALNFMRQKRVRGLIIDLRDNPGGDLKESLRIAARFVPSGPLVWVRKKGSEPRPIESGSGETFHAPVVVLINEGSASASEVLSGALSDNGKAVLVGHQTFGKGVIQTSFKLTGGAELRLTTESYLTPGKRNINGVGIPPKYRVKGSRQDKNPVKDPFVIAGWKIVNAMARKANN